MRIMNNSYNVLTVDIGTVTADTDTTIGTSADYQVIKAVTAKSGLIRVKATIGGNTMFGTCEVNPWAAEDKLECTSLTNYGDSPKAVVATIWEEGGLCKANISVTSL